MCIMRSRFMRVAVCLLLCVCICFSCVGPVYAEAITVVTLGTLAVIAAVLTATGLVMSTPEAFDGLCHSVYDTLSAAGTLKNKISLKVLAGLSYIPTSIASAIADAAAKTSAYKPVAQSTYTYKGVAYPFFDKNYDIPHSSLKCVAVFKWSDFVNCPKTVSYPIGDFTLMVEYPGVRSIFFESPVFSFSSVSGSRNFETFEGFISELFVSSNGFSYYLYMGRTISLTSSWLGSSYVTIGRVDTDSGNISANFPWDTTKDLPSISADGILSLNQSWLSREFVVSGAASLPLSVPSDTVAGSATQTQDDAQIGDKTLGVSDAVVSGSAASDFVKKSALQGLSLLDFFPFCIPFDLVKGVKLLVAPAKSPVFDIPIKIPYLDQQTLHVDLTQFSGVAVFSRWFLTLAFVLGLAGITGKVMKW
ncbi:MAG: hypothetical protein RSD27_01730 [Ruthenibacterium sp.]